jgi:DNA-binding CsgD family transcriptional regulator
MIVKSIEISDASGKTERLDIKKHEIAIPNAKNSLLIRYSFPMYSNESVMFQSYIEGIDTGWSEPILKPEFKFERLPRGKYTIYVKASNNWLETSQTDQISISVLPPWYLNGLSFILYILIVIGTIIVSRRALINRFRLREQKIREGKERELIRLRNEKLNSELSYKSQELANSTMSILKKNEFLLEIKEIIKAQKEELGLRYPEKYYQKLIRKIDTNISSIDDWKLFETHFERAHEKFLHKLMNTYPSLSPSDLRLCAYLRMNLSSKEIAPLLKISVRGVENHRYKLRKKLNLKPDENLIDFILGL